MCKKSPLTFSNCKASTFSLRRPSSLPGKPQASVKAEETHGTYHSISGFPKLLEHFPCINIKMSHSPFVLTEAQNTV